MSAILSDSDLDRIRLAVGEAEQRTSGEIVPYIVEQSGSYEVAVWRGASGAALLTMAATVLTLQFYAGWGFGWLFTSWGMALLVSVAGVAGAFAATFIAPLKRLLIGSELMARKVHRRASLAFLEEEVFNTRDRTGILLFVSIFEHRIEVLGDTGISEQVTDDEWIDIVDTVRRGIREDHFADGLVEAVGMCGALLERKGVAVRPDDTDELPDNVRLRKE